MRQTILLALVLTLSAWWCGAVAQTTTEELWIANGERRIYGVLSRPDDGRTRHPVAIIAHGFNGSHQFSRSYFGLMNELGYMCYAFDFPCGSLNSRSDNNTVGMSVLDQVGDLKAIVGYFKSRPDVDASATVVVGESQGGLVSALTAAEIPDDVDRLILVFPALCIPDDWNKRFPRLEEVPDTTLVWGVPLGRRYFEEVRSLAPLDVIAAYTNPVLIVQGDADNVVALDDSRHAVERYRDARLHVIPGAGHGFNPEQLQEEFRAIRAFLLSTQP